MGGSGDDRLRVAFTTVATDTREQAVALADHYHDFQGVRRVFDLAWAHCQVELRHLHLTAQEAHLYQRMAAYILYAGAATRAAAEIIKTNQQGQPALWRFGISGDLPIVLVRVAEVEQLPLVRQMFAAHTYLRQKGLQFDLVVLNEHQAGYFEISAAVAKSGSRRHRSQPARQTRRHLSAEGVSPAARGSGSSCSRRRDAYSSARGTLGSQLDRARTWCSRSGPSGRQGHEEAERRRDGQIKEPLPRPTNYRSIMASAALQCRWPQYVLFLSGDRRAG